MKCRILAIDDEVMNLNLIETYLDDEELYEVITAIDGNEGWHILQKSYQDIDLILLDRMMPNMDGMELVAKIKEHPEISRIPVILQTAAAEKSQIEEGIQAGVYHYLTKPYTEQSLVSMINMAIGK